jgi:hypothetical protein
MATADEAMSKEREFIENLVEQRFNFFVLFFTLIMSGVVGARYEIHFKVALGMGALVSWMITYTLIIANWKLNCILRKLPKDHPFHIVDREVHLSGRNWIGYWIPIVCSSFLTFALMLAICGHVRVAS